MYPQNWRKRFLFENGWKIVVGTLPGQGLFLAIEEQSKLAGEECLGRFVDWQMNLPKKLQTKSVFTFGTLLLSHLDFGLLRLIRTFWNWYKIDDHVGDTGDGFRSLQPLGRQKLFFAGRPTERGECPLHAIHLCGRRGLVVGGSTITGGWQISSLKVARKRWNKAEGMYDLESARGPFCMIVVSVFTKKVLNLPTGSICSMCTFFSDDLSPAQNGRKQQARTSINIAKSLGSRFIFAPWHGHSNLSRPHTLEGWISNPSGWKFEFQGSMESMDRDMGTL